MPLADTAQPHWQQQLARYRVVPVIKLERAADALPLAQALLSGGLPVAEVTLRTEAALTSIGHMAAVPGMYVGAGTVTTVEQARRAVGAGARFLVTPGFSPAIAQFCRDGGVPLIAGAVTPTELMALMDSGFSVAKFFPAEQFGGLDAITALSAPFPDLRFLPTGGISPSNLVSYLSSPKVLACGGSWMVRDSLIRQGNFAEITRLTQAAVALAAEAPTP